MKSRLTSFTALFGAAGAIPIERVEIPLIQRDYAQGREGESVARIRRDFLDVLYDAVTDGDQVSLDFVYGDVVDGTLRPLDGQQRLTTLFLLHWYLAMRADRLDERQEWKRFSYATRPSARLFCERLVTHRPSTEVDGLASWITDQPWFLHTWQHDPTIGSMLVMLDAMHARFADVDAPRAWSRLVDGAAPAVTFHLLPLDHAGTSGEDLYIKMNSRGKPLTPFENFKARFEKMLEHSPRVAELATKIDGAWSDLLWPYRGDDDIIDDEFLRYFRFVSEVCAWGDSAVPAADIDSLAEQVYGPNGANAADHLAFLISAFDLWVGMDVPGVLGDAFALVSSPNETEKVVLFGHAAGDVDLFRGCCATYGETRGRNRVFGVASTLFLYAVVLHRLHNTTDFSRRLRRLRNLVEASSNELRLERMPALIADVLRIIVDGTLDDVTAFNQAQVSEERAKIEFLDKNPDVMTIVFQLEDHRLLRGCLAAFELDADLLPRQVASFHRVFADPAVYPSLTGALLAVGDYSRRLDHRAVQLGSGTADAPWRDLLTAGGRTQVAAMRDVLGRLLDSLADAKPVRDELDAIRQRWLDAVEPNQGLDWRWYLVKYPAMRVGASGIYVGQGGMGYRLCMMNKRQMNSYYRDAFLFAVYRELGAPSTIEDPWFTGYETDRRAMTLVRSGVEIECAQNGFVLRAPSGAAEAANVTRVCATHGVGPDGILLIRQTQQGAPLVDADDRVSLGAAFLRDLIDAGL